MNSMISRPSAEREHRGLGQHERAEAERHMREAGAKMSREAGRRWAKEHATADQLRSFERCDLPDASDDLHRLVDEHIRERPGRLVVGDGDVDSFEFRRGALSVWREAQAWL
jgi:hypothetical protein